MGTRLFAHAHRVVLDLSSSTHPLLPSLPPPRSLSLSLRATEGGDAPAGCVFPAAALVHTEKDEAASVFRSRLLQSVWGFSTLTFIFIFAPTSFFSFFFFLHGGVRQRKPADET